MKYTSIFQVNIFGALKQWITESLVSIVAQVSV